MDLLARFESFCRVVDMGSLARAARSLGRSAPAVSRQLASLERELGQTLLIRDTRHLAVTPEGQRFYEHARRALQSVADARESVRPDRSARGTLVVTTSVTLGVLLLVPALPRLFARHPELAIELRLEDRLTDMVREGVDVGLRAGIAPTDSADLLALRVQSYPRLLVGAPSYLAARGVPHRPEELSEHALLQSTRWLAERTLVFERDGVEHPVAVRGPLRVDTLLGLREAALAGLGLAVVTEFAVRSELAAGRLLPLLPSYRLPEAVVSAVYRRELARSPRVRALLGFLRTGLP